MATITAKEEYENPNEVKVVVNNNNEAMYFSREPIPSMKKGATELKMLKQVCIIPFKVDYLRKYQNMHPTHLEIVESVDMNRILENGEKVHMVYTKEQTYAVDTPEDLKVVEREMKNDGIMPLYMK